MGRTERRETKDEEEEGCVGGVCREPDPDTGLDLHEVSGAEGSRGGLRRRQEDLQAPTWAREEEAGGGRAGWKEPRTEAALRKVCPGRWQALKAEWPTLETASHAGA